MTHHSPTHSYVQIDRQAMLDRLARCRAETTVPALRQQVAALRAWVEDARQHDRSHRPPAPSQAVEGETRLLRRDVLLAELDQILEARTLNRAHYYLDRLQRSVTRVRTTAVNDINLNRWKEYDDVLTDSLWIVDRRDTSGAHGAWYWGNFVPQIPHQLMLRYTRSGDWVLDPFAGSGTTLIECRRLGRNGLGVELNSEVATRAMDAVAEEPNPFGITTDIAQGDSAQFDFRGLLDAHGIEQVQLAILHPPYHDIIRFGEDAHNLSNAPTLETFLEGFSAVVARVRACLAPGRHLAVVIGDKYEGGEWIPLGFYVMQAVMTQGLTLKSVIVKNFESTRAKREQQALWRYRALAGGFYVFKHEYIFLFQD